MKDLTGEYRFRNEGDLLVLQVLESEWSYSGHGAIGGESTRVWRDAKIEDLLNVQFCPNKCLPDPIAGRVE